MATDQDKILGLQDWDLDLDNAGDNDSEDEMSSFVLTASPPKKSSGVVNHPSPRHKKNLAKASNKKIISVLTKEERQKIHVHLDKINKTEAGELGGKFSFLEFGTDSQAVKGLKPLLGIDDKYSDEMVKLGEETMRSEVEALKKEKGDPSNWFCNPCREEDGSYNWNERVPNLNEVIVERLLKTLL